MTIYYQHIGEKLWARDAPRSIGTDADGLKRFCWQDIDPFLESIDGWGEQLQVRSKLASFAPTGFQIWGIPSGAQQVLAGMDTGDFLMLLESVEFAYVGQVIHKFSEPCWAFPCIFGERALPFDYPSQQGEMVAYPWDKFRTDFGFALNYHMRGNTMKLSDERLAASPYASEEDFIASILTTKGIKPLDQERDFQAFGNNLQIHLKAVKERANQQFFRSKVIAQQGRCCCVCDINILAVLDAAHIIPKEYNGTDDPRNGLSLCALHHRMFDSGLILLPSGYFENPSKGPVYYR